MKKKNIKFLSEFFQFLEVYYKKHAYSNILKISPPKTEAVFMSTHNLWFLAEIRKIMYTPVNPSFYYIKVGFKGVNII